MSTDFRALCAELATELEAWEKADDQFSEGGTLRADANYGLAPRARAELAHPEPVAPTDETKEAMISALNTLEGWDNFDHWVWPVSALEQSKKNTTESLQMLRAVLARWGTPANNTNQEDYE
jgi:hypothetical protein